MSPPPTGWATVVVPATADEVDEVSGRLWAAGVAGIEERAGSAGSVELRAGVPAGDAAGVLAALEGRPATVEDVVDAGLDAWRSFARSWRAGRHLVVVPPWLAATPGAGEGDLVLAVDPGHAFGSGAHPTTRMCLAELERVVRADDAVADVGCGSGVLAVAAARLGAAAVRAVDVEPEAVRATEANATRNGVAERVEASTAPATALSPDAHTVVVANIGVGVLEQLAPALALAAAPGATLVLGGLLADQVPRVRAAVEGVGLVATDERAEGEWRTLVARRP